VAPHEARPEGRQTDANTIRCLYSPVPSLARPLVNDYGHAHPRTVAVVVVTVVVMIMMVVAVCLADRDDFFVVVVLRPRLGLAETHVVGRVVDVGCLVCRRVGQERDARLALTR